MANDKKPGCRINDCGEPFALLEDGRAKPEEDDFRACAKHLKELKSAFAKLRGD